jgi:hypothetical protein
MAGALQTSSGGGRVGIETAVQFDPDPDPDFGFDPVTAVAADPTP